MSHFTHTIVAVFTLIYVCSYRSVGWNEAWTGKVFISLKASQNFLLVLSHYLPVWHISPISLFPVKITIFQQGASWFVYFLQAWAWIKLRFLLLLVSSWSVKEPWQCVHSNLKMLNMNFEFLHHILMYVQVLKKNL